MQALQGGVGGVPRVPRRILRAESPRCCFKARQGEAVSTGTAQEQLGSAPRAGKQVPIWGIPSASPWFLASKINPAGTPTFSQKETLSRKILVAGRLLVGRFLLLPWEV